MNQKNDLNTGFRVTFKPVLGDDDPVDELMGKAIHREVNPGVTASVELIGKLLTLGLTVLTALILLPGQPLMPVVFVGVIGNLYIWIYAGYMHFAAKRAARRFVLPSDEVSEITVQIDVRGIFWVEEDKTFYLAWQSIEDVQLLEFGLWFKTDIFDGIYLPERLFSEELRAWKVLKMIEAFRKKPLHPVNFLD